MTPTTQAPDGGGPPALHALTDLLALPPADADRFLAETDPETLVGLVDQASDTDLARLAAVEHLRDAAVLHVLGRLSEFAVPERLAEVRGLARFRVDVPDADPIVSDLCFDGAGVVLQSSASTEPPDVVIDTGVVDFLRMISGGRNAALLALGGRLTVDGDTDLALRIGGVFQVPGQPGVAVDPAAVDPAEAARLLGGVDDRHLQDVMAGGFRAVVLEQVFSRFPEFLDTAKADGHALTVGFKITRDGGDADRYVVRIDNGTCRVDHEADPGGHRDATLTLGGVEFLKLVTGHLSPVTGVMRGAIKVRGDVAVALALHRIMRIPG